MKQERISPSPLSPAVCQEEIDYLRRCCELDTAKILQMDNQSVALRQELEQKRRGFELMAELSVTLGQDSDYEQVFVSVSKRINAALNMHRTAVLAPCPDGPANLFRPMLLQGYPAEEERQILPRRLEVDAELLDPEKPVLITSADSPDRLASLRRTLGLPFLISAPVILHNTVVALLITGRLREQIPFMSRLGHNDVETVQTVSAYLAAMLAASRMAEAEKRNRIMLDATPLCCSLWDESLQILDCNQEAARLFGLSGKQEYLDRFPECSPLYQPNGRLSMELAKEKVREVFATGYARFEWLHQKPDAEPIPSEIIMVRIKRNKDHIVVSYARDLREQKAMLADIRKKENELRLARDLAEKNARVKSEFLANMSHEIRTPMNAILGMAHLLAGTALSKEQQRYVDQAAHSARLLLRIINDILDFSKIEAGRLEMESTAFSLRQLAGNVLDLMKGQAGAKSLKLLLHMDPDLPDTLLGDPVRLEQVLLNLVSNALKFSSAGVVAVRVSRSGDPASPEALNASNSSLTASKSPPASIWRQGFEDKSLQSVSSVKCSGPEKARLLFEVKDNGIGMSREQVAGLFTAFSQADSSTTRKYGGTGLGLAISRSLVGLMDGHIWCDSRPGEGSTFSFTANFALPAAGHCPAIPPESSDGESGPAGTGTVQSEKSAQDGFADLRGMRILLAEDNEVNQMIAIDLLAVKGVEVDAVNNGREAVEALMRGAAYDLVLMDIQMPEMSGLTATEHIRADPRFTGLPIIAMTAHAMTGDRELSIRGGMNDHLTKPIDPHLLYTALRRWRRKG